MTSPEAEREGSAPTFHGNAIVILLDSLNRHTLGFYGGRQFQTPHLDAIAERSAPLREALRRSAAVHPARQDILCGALDFLWKPGLDRYLGGPANVTCLMRSSP